jgi:hypothetical protein
MNFYRVLQTQPNEFCLIRVRRVETFFYDLPIKFVACGFSSSCAVSINPSLYRCSLRAGGAGSHLGNFAWKILLNGVPLSTDQRRGKLVRNPILGFVFELSRDVWFDGDGRQPSRIRRVVRLCLL